MPRPRKKPGELGKPTTREIGGAWRSRADIRDGAGKMHHIEAWGPTAADAEAALLARANKIWGGAVNALGDVTTVGQLAAVWLADVDNRPDAAIEQSSREAYHSRVKSNILPYLSAVPLDQLTPGFIHQLLQRQHRDRSYSFASTTRKTLSSMLSFAALNGAIPGNPMRDVPKLRNNAPKPKIKLDEDQMLLIIGLVRSWRGRNPQRAGGARPNVRLLEDFILIMLGTSYRPGEVLALRLDDVQMLVGNAKVSVTGTVSYTKRDGNIRKDHPKHREQKRTVTVPGFTHAVLRRLVANYTPNDDQLLLTTRNDTAYQVTHLSKMMRAFREQHRDLLTRVGVDVDLLTPYALRKTVASVLNEEAGANLAASVLGHHDPRITLQHYARRIREVDPTSADILNRAFARLGDQQEE